MIQYLPKLILRLNYEDITFTYKSSINCTISNDTLIQQGVEKIDSIGVNRLNIEKYIRMQ